MNNSVYDLWKKVVKYGENSKEKDLDGYESWNRLRNILDKYPIIGKWKIESLSLYDQILDLGLSSSNKVEKSTWRKNYYYIQLGRIPKKNLMKPTLLKLLRVAFNVGQLRQIMINNNDSFYTDMMKDFYLTNNLDSADTYMDKCVLDLMSKEIDNDLTKEINELNKNLLSNVYNTETETTDQSSSVNQIGGYSAPYQNKYLKYKSKYLKLKMGL
mgnify:CR=1 FL=1